MVLQFRGDRHVDAIPGSRDDASRRGASRRGASRDGAPRDGAPRDGAPRDGAPRDGAPRNDDATSKQCTSNVPLHEHTHHLYGSHTSDILFSVYLVHGKSSKYSPNNLMRLSTECRIEQTT